MIQIDFSLSATILSDAQNYLKQIPGNYSFSGGEIHLHCALQCVVLWENDGVPEKQLSIKLILNTGTFTPLLKRIETAGLITRTRTSSDERSVIINLTPPGTALKEKAYAVPGELLCSSWLGIDELKRLRGELKMLLDKLNKNENEGCSGD